MKSFWLVKQEPSSYSWSDFVGEGQTSWTGVRNYAARNNLRRMRKGDEVLFYHSGEDKAVVGIAKVMRTAYRDPTAKDGDWSTVDLAPLKPLRHPGTIRGSRGFRWFGCRVYLRCLWRNRRFAKLLRWHAIDRSTSPEDDAKRIA